VEIYFIRHGESKADLENKIESRYDAELTEKGNEEARLASIYFKEKGIEFTQILSSPLKRAVKTAKLIAENQNTEMIIDADLAEIDRGVLCGLDRVEADEKYPRKLYRTHYDYYPENSGESAYLVRSRANRMLQKIMSADTERLLVVSHGAFLNGLLSALLMIPDSFNEETGGFFAFRDCEYIHIKKKPESDKFVILEKGIAK